MRIRGMAVAGLALVLSVSACGGSGGNGGGTGESPPNYQFFVFIFPQVAGGQLGIMVQNHPCQCQKFGPTGAGSLSVPSAPGKIAVLCGFLATAQPPFMSRINGTIAVDNVAFGSASFIEYKLLAQHEGAAQTGLSYAPGVEANGTNVPIVLSLDSVSTATTLTAWGCKK